mmetsp:Transcript_6430/g.12740  ORF Transcript_6430/g.12740 Transcript_6430/m.12740 type:complete len:229 (-) Transcript_6430:13-699(-)
MGIIKAFQSSKFSLPLLFLSCSLNIPPKDSSDSVTPILSKSFLISSRSMSPELSMSTSENNSSNFKSSSLARICSPVTPNVLSMALPKARFPSSSVFKACTGAKMAASLKTLSTSLATKEHLVTSSISSLSSRCLKCPFFECSCASTIFCNLLNFPFNCTTSDLICSTSGPCLSHSLSLDPARFSGMNDESSSSRQSSCFFWTLDIQSTTSVVSIHVERTLLTSARVS